MWKQKQNKEKTMKIWIARNEQLMEVHSKWKVKHNQSINGKFRRRNRRNGVSSIKAVSRWRWWRRICSRHWKSQCHCQMDGMEYASLCKCTHRTAWSNHRIVCMYSHSKRVRDLMQFVHKTKLYCTPFIIEVLNVCVCTRVYFFSTHSPALHETSFSSGCLCNAATPPKSVHTAQTYPFRFSLGFAWYEYVCVHLN